VPRAGPPVTQATPKSPSSLPATESCGTRPHIAVSRLVQRSQLDTAHERQKWCLRTVDGASMRSESSTKWRSVVSRKEMSLRCGSVTRDDGAGPGPSASSHTARQCGTRRTSSRDNALSTSSSSGRAMSAPVVNSLTLLWSQSGARMFVSDANVRYRRSGALLPKSTSGRTTGGPLSTMDSTCFFWRVLCLREVD
jgi:hypothetical protein